MIKTFMIAIPLLFSSAAFAKNNVICKEERLVNVAVNSNGDLIYTLKNGSQRLAFKGANASSNQVLAPILMSALFNDLYVESVYPAGFNCEDRGEFTTEALQIRVTNPTAVFRYNG